MSQQDRPSLLRHQSAFSRRDSFRLFGAAGLAAFFGGAVDVRAQEAAKPTLSNGDGFYRMSLGTSELYLISDGGFPMDTASLFGSVPERAMEEARKQAFLTKPAVPGHVNVLLVKDGTNLMLIDTGCGKSFGETTGFLPKNLARAGFSPSDITHVIITHAHPDHIGGLVDGDRLTFPNARVFVNAAEHTAWTVASPQFPKTKVPVEMLKAMVEGARHAFEVATPKLELLKPTDQVGGIITVVDAPGHTPGHIALRIDSAGEPVLYLTDTVHVPSLQFAHPQWHVLYDADPELAARTRKMILDQVVRERRMVAGSHIPFPSFGHLVAQGNGFGFVPIVWEW